LNITPIVLIEKKDQSLRICLDFRDLSKQTIFDPVLMPRMDEVLNKVSKARYISKLDLTKGYWQDPTKHLLGLATSFASLKD
jgi:hypothetical protein